jgi:hypothetical protein
MKINDKTRIQVLEWHKQAFPDTSLMEQQIKFYEELKELDEIDDYEVSDEKILEELADCIIVITSFRRFDKYSNEISYICSEALLSIVRKFWKPLLKDEEINKAILKKIEINKKRTWQKINGTYHHV